MSTGLTVQGLNVARSGKAILHDVDLTISPGTITALLGANGAGKSSLVLAIAGVLQVSSGAIALDGRSIVGQRRLSCTGRRGRAGHQVLNDLSVEDNLKVAELPAHACPTSAALANASTHFRARERASARDLSGGQQQIGRWRAIIGKPRYCFRMNCRSVWRRSLSPS